MLLFDTPLADDDLTVLSAYVAAQDLAESIRKSQPQAEPQGDEADDAGANSEDVDPSTSENDEAVEKESAQSPKGAPRRTYTWVSRLHDVEGIASECMAPIHGRLIAHGLLQFQLQGREQGVVYRVTAAGRQALNTTSGAEAA